MKFINFNPHILWTIVVFSSILPVIISHTDLQIENSNKSSSNSAISPGTQYSVWLYSFVAIILVSASGFIGILLVPFMNRSFYNVCTQYLIALSVGSLIGDAFLHLIPHALLDHEHSHEESNHHFEVIKKGLVILLGFYAFFLTERITILYQNNSTRKKMKKRWAKKSPNKCSSFEKKEKIHPTTSFESKFGGNNKTGSMYDPMKSSSDESICSMNSRNNQDRHDDCLEKDTALSSDHSHLICTSEDHNHQNHCEDNDEKVSLLSTSKVTKVNEVEEEEEPLVIHNKSPTLGPTKGPGGGGGGGMTSHVGGVDTAPPSFPSALPLRCHHVNMRHCRSPNVRHHHHLHRRIFHINSQHEKNPNAKLNQYTSNESRRALSDINIDSRFTSNMSPISNKSTGINENPPAQIHHHGHTHHGDDTGKFLPSFLGRLLTSNKDHHKQHSHKSQPTNMPDDKSNKNNSNVDEHPKEHKETESRLITKKRIRSSQSDSNLIAKMSDDGISIKSEAFFTPTTSKERLDFETPLDVKDGNNKGLSNDDELNKQLGKSPSKGITSTGHVHHHSHCLPSGYSFVSPLRDKPHGHHHGHSHDLSSVRSIAYTIIAGDGLHNFCDGIAIGAAFSADFKIGLSTFLAVICHELPHELGDFAVLLNAGMPVKTVIFYNCLTGIFCLTGMIIGVLLSNYSELITNWLFLATAGIFIYIALVDMVPELATQRLKGKYAYHRPTVLFIVQNFGLFTGVGVMTLIALNEKNIG